MIIDAHYHLEERMETVDELLAQMKEHNVDRVALIPTLVDPVHLNSLQSMAGSMMPGMLLARFRSIGFLFYKTTVTADGSFSALGEKFTIYDKPENESVARVLQDHGDKFYGWIFVNPVASNPLVELEKWADQPGWIGVKAHPFWHRYAVKRLDEVGAYCVERDWPVLIHLGGDQENGDFSYLPERHPGLKIIYAHAGVPFYREVWEYVSRREGTYIDLSNPVYVSDRVRLDAVKTVGVEKCLHATDGPYGDAGQGSMVNKILQLPLSDGEKERILGGNFLDLLG
jgi:predicted TIM-barrel fold metal-dependent hydrolase